MPMPDLTLPAIAAAAGGAWVLGLWYLGLHEHPSVRGWRRLARLRGLGDRRPLGERVPVLRRAQEETDVGRLLAIAGRRDTAAAWLLRAAFQAGLTLAAVLILDEAALMAGQPPPLPPALGVAAAACIAVLAYARLHRQAEDRRRALGQAVADSLPHLAVMTFHHRVPASEALLIFARCQRDPALRRLLEGDGWRRLIERGSTVGTEHTANAASGESTALIYERIGQAYGVPMFCALASGVQRVTERGLAGQDVYTGLARTTYAERLARARVAAAQARTLIVVPMGLMIVPVLILIGAPLVASLAGIFAR